MKWAVLGGGLAGVTLARLLHERGHEVQVFEQETETGGLCRSRTGNGFTFDSGGSHVIFSRDEEVLSFMHRVLGENREVRERKTKIFYKGRYVKYPFENGLANLPKEDLFFCFYEFVKTLIAAEKGELDPPANFRDWMYRTFGKGIAESYLIPYNEKIWKLPPEKMSCHWVEGRIPRPPVEDVIRSAIGIETEGYTHQAIFSYPRSGGDRGPCEGHRGACREIYCDELACHLRHPARGRVHCRSRRADGSGSDRGRLHHPPSGSPLVPEGCPGQCGEGMPRASFHCAPVGLHRG